MYKGPRFLNQVPTLIETLIRKLVVEALRSPVASSGLLLIGFKLNFSTFGVLIR